ncbi:hypothetical protein EV193_101935 [Herbihabitans rhizosphaerae]|uniref:Uncharacterized protein n=1 Tax=Herbihabitans rhizosphaerae TaxID=1872711 RepID=A0A4Q7L8Q9_9PSEU|nr:hypothetical protein EV193_101935 [Herbihabitans rhizosphaerae]
MYDFGYPGKPSPPYNGEKLRSDAGIGLPAVTRTT